MKAGLPAKEKQQREALHPYDVLGTPAEAAFDDLTQLAARLCAMPIALIVLAGKPRPWVKSRHGLGATRTDQDLPFCTKPLLQAGLLVVPDATKDARFQNDPQVTGEPRLRFYAGAPLVTAEGLVLGALCVMDRQPRELSLEGQEILRVLARQVVTQLELRRSVRELGEARTEQARADAARGRAEGELDDQIRQRAVAADRARAARPSLWASPLLAVKIAGSYALAGGLWILFSDQLLGTLVPDQETVIRLGIYKGWFFVLVTAGLLAWVLERYLRRVRCAEAELTESEERFRLLVSAVSDYAIFMLDPTGKVTSWNPGAQRILGYRSDEIQGKSFSSFYPPKDVADGKPRLALRAAETQGCFQEEGCHMHKTGRTFWANATITAVRDAEGKLLGFAEVTRDITERKQAEEELRRTNRALRAIGACNHGVTHATEETELLQEMCRVIVVDAGYRLAWVGIAEQDEARTVRPVAQAGYEEGYLETLRLTWADTERGRGPVGMAIRTGEHFVVQNIASEPFFAPWREEAARRGYASTLALPLRRAGRVFGALAIYAAEPDAFDASEVSLLSGLAADLVFGLDGIQARGGQQQAEAALQAAHQRLQALSRHLVEVQEAERRHLARELHDEIGQGLTAFKMNLQGLQSAPDLATQQRLAQQGIDFVDHLLEEVRTLSLKLRPPMLDDLGLQPALRWLVNQASREGGFKTRLTVDPALLRLNPALETACFRVIQEALTNAVRHAGASEVDITVRLERDALRLSVQDNGRGFDYAAARRRAETGLSLGLMTMEERASLVGGRLECHSAAGVGTELAAVFPVHSETASELPG